MVKRTGDPIGTPESFAQVAPTPTMSRRPSTNHRTRYFWFLLQVIWGVLLGIGLFIVVNQVFEVSRTLSDFCQDYVAAQRLTQGIQVYLPLHCWKGSGIIYWPAPFEYDAHPPSSILLVWPLSFLSRVQAATIWGLLSLGAYLASGFMLLHALGWRSLRSLALFVWGSIFWNAFTNAEVLQNSAQVLLLLLVGGWFLNRRRHPGWAGILFGIAGLLKIWPATLLLIALVQQKWRLFWSELATLVLGTLLTMLIVGPSAYASYLGPVRETELYWIPSGGNISLVGAIARPLAGYLVPSAMLKPLVLGVSVWQAAFLGQAISGLLFVLTLVFLWHCWQNAPEDLAETASLGMSIPLLLLVFPLTWQWGLLFLLLPLATTLLILRRIGRLPLWWYVLFVVSLLPQADPLLDLSVSDWMAHLDVPGVRGLGILMYGLPTYGLLLFASAQAWLLWRAHGLEPTNAREAGQE